MEKVAKKLQNYKTYKFFCEFCLYGCNNKTNFEKHKNTNKHQKNCNTANGLTKKLSHDFYCKICNKKYKHRQSLFSHQKICKNNVSQLAKLAKNLPEISQSPFTCKCGKLYKHASSLSKHKSKCKLLHHTIKNKLVPTNNVEILLKALLEKNNDILEENKNLREKISSMEINNITNNNQKYTINMFLNEKCKNAMNIEDFVEKIKLSLEDLQFTKENGYAKGISNIFIKNLNDMDVTERPIHCSDQKRMQFYVKDADEWKKDKNNAKIDNTIAKVSKKQIQNLEDWCKENPDYLDSDVKIQEYYKLVRSLSQPNDDKNLRSIKKKLGENVKIERENYEKV